MKAGVLLVSILSENLISCSGGDVKQITALYRVVPCLWAFAEVFACDCGKDFLIERR